MDLLVALELLDCLPVLHYLDSTEALDTLVLLSVVSVLEELVSVEDSAALLDPYPVVTCLPMAPNPPSLMRSMDSLTVTERLLNTAFATSPTKFCEK